MIQNVEIIHFSTTDSRLAQLPIDEALSPAEEARIARYQRIEDRVRARSAWGVLRMALAKWMRSEPGSLVFLRNAFGKPFLSEGPSFNMAHSGDAVLIGVTESGRLGVDIEFERPIANLGHLVELTFSPEEAVEFHALPEAERCAAFYRAWTRKEAFVKAIGQGLSFPLDSFSVSLASGWRSALVSVQTDEERAVPWCIKSIPVPGGAEAAIALDRADVAIAWTPLPS